MFRALKAAWLRLGWYIGLSSQHGAPSIRMRISVALIVFALLPTIVAGLIMFEGLRRFDQKEAIANIKETLLTMASDIDRIQQQSQNVVEVLTLDNLLRNVSRDIIDGLDKEAEIDAYRDITERIKIATVNIESVRIRIFLPSSSLLTRERVTLFSTSDLDAALLNLTSATSGWSPPYAPNTVWNARQAQYITFMKIARISKQRILFIVAADVPVSALTSMLRKSSIAGTFELRMMNDTVIAQVTNDNFTRGEVRSFETPCGVWTLYAHVPMNQYYTNSYAMLWTLVVTMALVCVLIPIVASHTAIVLSRSIDALTVASKDAMEGRYHDTPIDSPVWEIRYLQSAFNEMISRIDCLINDVYETQVQREKMRLSSLFEQIKPHFLYNTLDCGKWLALRNHDDATALFLEKLSALFRVSLSQGAEFISLRQEFKHIELYVDVMNYRSGYNITLIIDADADKMDMPILRFLLQPLVENAIIHGITQMPDKKGTIMVTVRYEDDCMIIVISDDGIGLPTTIACEQTEGFGMGNVSKRMMLYYGSLASMTIQNHEPQGAQVALRLPMVGFEKDSGN